MSIIPIPFLNTSAVINYPTLVSSGQNTSTTTSVSIPLNSTAQAGDIIVLLAVTSGTTTATGYTSLDSGTITSGTAKYYVGYKTASGGETSVSVSSSTVNLIGIAYLFRGATTPQLSGANVTLGNAIDSPSLTPTGGAKGYYWITAGMLQGGYLSSTAPSGYTEGYHSIDVINGGIIRAGAMSAARKLFAATEDPGAWTMGSGSSGSGSRCVTIAIPPS